MYIDDDIYTLREKYEESVRNVNKIRFSCIGFTENPLDIVCMDEIDAQKLRCKNRGRISSSPTDFCFESQEKLRANCVCKSLFNYLLLSGIF